MIAIYVVTYIWYMWKKMLRVRVYFFECVCIRRNFFFCLHCFVASDLICKKKEKSTKANNRQFFLWIIKFLIHLMKNLQTKSCPLVFVIFFLFLYTNRFNRRRNRSMETRSKKDLLHHERVRKPQIWKKIWSIKPIEQDYCSYTLCFYIFLFPRLNRALAGTNDLDCCWILLQCGGVIEHVIKWSIKIKKINK